MLRFCQRFVLMLECETFCALSFRFPVMSLFAMTTLARCPIRSAGPRTNGAENAAGRGGNLTDCPSLVKHAREGSTGVPPRHSDVTGGLSSGARIRLAAAMRALGA